MGSDQPAPLALPQNHLSTRHPHSSSVLQQFHTQAAASPTPRNSIVHSAPAFPVQHPMTPALLQASNACLPLSFLTADLASSTKWYHTRRGGGKAAVMVIGDAHFHHNTFAHAHILSYVECLFSSANISEDPSCERFVINSD